MESGDTPAQPVDSCGPGSYDASESREHNPYLNLRLLRNCGAEIILLVTNASSRSGYVTPQCGRDNNEGFEEGRRK